jgi:hypothetical protein
MPVNIITSSSKFYNEFKNDVGFVSNLSDFTVNLTGLVMERVKTIQQVDVSWFSKSKLSNATWSVDTTAGTLISNTGSFITDGFAVGDEFYYEDISAMAGTNFTAIITAIQPLTIYFTLLTGSRINIGDTDAVIRGVEPLTALDNKFGLIENNENFNIQSKVSGGDQGFYADDIGLDIGGGVRDTNFVNMIRLGVPKDFQTGTMRVRFVSDNYNPATAQSGHQTFIIEHDFLIVPWYLEGELFNMLNKQNPQLFLGLNTVKYVFQPEFKVVRSNPNTSKISNIDNNLGSVAWYDENFNGYQSDYEIVSVDYEEAATSNTADGLLIGSKTRTTIVAKKLSGPFSVADRFGVYFSYLPEQSEYENPPMSLIENFIFDRAINNEGLAPVVGDDFITSCVASIVSGELVVVVESEYSPTQKAFLASKFSQAPTYYAIGLEVGDNTNSNAASDRVMLLADVELYDESADIPDLMNVTKFDFYQHDKVIGVDTGTTDSITWNEDNIAIDHEFSLNLAKQASLNNLEFRLVGYNDITGQMFELDNYVYQSIGSAIVSSGVQQLNINTNRGYNLATGSQFNEVSIETDALVSQDQFYSGVIGQKIKWQDWLFNNNVDTVFYNSSEENNNLNFKSSNYSLLNDYSIRCLFYANLDGVSDLGVSGNTNYFFLSPAVNVYDYDEDGNVTPIWSATIETFHPTTLVNLQGKVLSGTNTIMRTTWVNVAPPITSIDGMWAIHRIEETGQLGDAIDELSTINPYPSPNRVIPSVGETQLTIDPLSGNLITECLVDGSQIINGLSYNLSARLNHNASDVPIDAKITEQDIVKITEASAIKIVE